MLCVECGHPVNSLYTVYSSDNIKATTCKNCKKFADKYIEYDPVLVALDVALLRPQAMRHVIFNKMRSQTALFIRLHILILLFDVYIKWACTELAPDPHLTGWLAQASTAAQYGSFMLLSASETVLVNLVLFLLAKATTSLTDYRAFFTTILLSSIAKLLPLLTLIWDYDTSKVLELSQFLIGSATTELLSVSLGCSYLHAASMTAAALGVRWLICERLLWSWILNK